MNPNLSKLHPYPFEKLRQLFAGVTPNPNLREIRLSIGEPQHETPPFIKEALTAGLSGLANYPTTLGLPALRQAIAEKLKAQGFQVARRTVAKYREQLGQPPAHKRK